MIVKNESKVIIRCLTSLLGIIDYYVINDTGSTDDTPAQIERFMKKHAISGEIIYTQWKNFAHNRQQALQAAKGSPLASKSSDAVYLLFIDADDELMTNTYSIVDIKKWLTTIQTPYFHIHKDHEGVTTTVPFLIKINDPNITWEWYSPVHNQLKSTPSTDPIIIGQPIMYIHVNPNQGAKSHRFLQDIREKYRRDALILEAVPDKTGSQLFHLAQSWYDAEEFTKSSAWYTTLITNDSTDPETRYYCMFKHAVCAIRNKAQYPVIRDLLLAAHQCRPTRFEAIFELIKYAHDHQMWDEGYRYGKLAVTLAETINDSTITDTLLVDRRIHRHYLWDKFAVCAHNSGHTQDAIWALQKVLALGYCDAATSDIYQRYLGNLT